MKTNLKAGDILSCTSHKLLATLIQKFTRSRINHTAYVLEIWGELYVIDSQKDGTNPRKLEDWVNKFKYEIIVHRRLTISKEELELQNKRAMSKSGITPYDFKSLLWYQPKYLITGKWKGKENEDSESRMYCSEFVAWVVQLDNYWKLCPYDVYLQLKHDKRYATETPENINKKTNNLIKINDIYKDQKKEIEIGIKEHIKNKNMNDYTDFKEDEVKLKKYTLTRYKQDDKQTLGMMKVTDTAIVDTLELAWKNNEFQISRIPAGIYKVVKRNSEKYKDHFHILNVPDRDGVLIHNGNYNSQIKGCVLVGSGLSDMNKDGYQDVMNSKKTLAKMNELMPNEFLLEIIERF